MQSRRGAFTSQGLGLRLQGSPPWLFADSPCDKLFSAAEPGWTVWLVSRGLGVTRSHSLPVRQPETSSCAKFLPEPAGLPEQVLPLEHLMGGKEPPCALPNAGVYRPGEGSPPSCTVPQGATAQSLSRPKVLDPDGNSWPGRISGSALET